MRTTMTLEPDIAARIRELMMRSGESFKETVNTLLRRGLEAAASPPQARRFTIEARDLGARAGLDFDDIGDLLEHLEGSHHR